MKGPKIENIKDPKWLGKKVVKCYCSGEESEWLKILYQGIDRFFYMRGIGYESSVCYDVQDYQSEFDWHEWIEEEKKTKLSFNVGDKIRCKFNNNKDEYMEILQINPYGNGFKLYVKEHSYSNAETTYETYFIIAEEFADWELYVEDKPHQNKPQEELQFPYKVGDKIRINWWKPDFYVELMVLDIKKREVIVKRFPGEIICDAADSKSAFYQDIVQSTAWELYVENELKFPFNVGDKIKPEWWNNEGKHLEILEINGPYFAQYQPKEARFEIVAKKSWHNGNTINRSVTYLITDKEFTEWSLWKNPDSLNDAPRLQLKKKKTVAFALTRNSNDSFYLSELAYTYDSEDSKIIKRSPNTIQFPAVTKDGTVLEFEVDDES